MGKRDYEQQEHVTKPEAGCNYEIDQSLKGKETKYLQIISGIPDPISDVVDVLNKYGEDWEKAALNIQSLYFKYNPQNKLTNALESFSEWWLMQDFQIDIDEFDRISYSYQWMKMFSVQPQEHAWKTSFLISQGENYAEEVSLSELELAVQSYLLDNQLQLTSWNATLYQQFWGKSSVDEYHQYYTNQYQNENEHETVDQVDDKIKLWYGESITLTSGQFDAKDNTMNTIFDPQPEEVVLDYSNVSEKHKVKSWLTRWETHVRAYYDQSVPWFIALTGWRKNLRPLIYNELTIHNISHLEETVERKFISNVEWQYKHLEAGKKYIFRDCYEAKIHDMLVPIWPIKLDYSMTSRPQMWIVLAYRDSDQETYVDSEGKRVLVYNNIAIEKIKQPEKENESIDKHQEKVQACLMGNYYTLSGLFPDKVDDIEYQEYFNEFKDGHVEIDNRRSQTYVHYAWWKYRLNLTLDDEWFNESYNKNIQIPIDDISENGVIQEWLFEDQLKLEVSKIIETYFKKQPVQSTIQVPIEQEFDEGDDPESGSIPPTYETVPSTLCLDCVPVDAFKQGIVRAESHNLPHYVVNGWHNGVYSSAVGRYQHVRSQRRTRIMPFMDKHNGLTIDENDREWNEAIGIMEKNPMVMKQIKRNPNDKKYIINYLMNEHIQEGYMSHYISESVTTDARRAINNFSNARRHHPAEIMALVHFLWYPNLKVYLTQGRSALDENIRHGNISADQYLEKFSGKYNDRITSTYWGNENYLV